MISARRGGGGTTDRGTVDMVFRNIKSERTTSKTTNSIRSAEKRKFVSRRHGKGQKRGDRSLKKKRSDSAVVEIVPRNGIGTTA